jgi:hypothetical protein
MKPSWIKFSVRSLLFAVAIVCAWLGYHAKWHRDRDVFLDRHRPGTASQMSSHMNWTPWVLRLMGDPGYNVIDFRHPIAKDEFHRAVELFPESHIISKTAEAAAGPYRARMKAKP